MGRLIVDRSLSEDERGFLRWDYTSTTHSAEYNAGLMAVVHLALEPTD